MVVLEIELCGLDPDAMHLTNLGLHGLNAVLVACLLNSLTGSLGLFRLIGTLPVFLQKRRLIMNACILVLAVTVCSVLTWRQLQIWRNNISLWQACLKVDPDNFRGHDQLALALLADDQIEEPLRESQIALRYVENRSYGGTYAVHTSDLGESKQLFTQALKYVPMNVVAMGNLANCEAEEGNFA